MCVWLCARWATLIMVILHQAHGTPACRTLTLTSNECHGKLDLPHHALIIVTRVTRRPFTIIPFCHRGRGKKAKAVVRERKRWEKRSLFFNKSDLLFLSSPLTLTHMCLYEVEDLQYPPKRTLCFWPFLTLVSSISFMVWQMKSQSPSSSFSISLNFPTSSPLLMFLSCLAVTTYFYSTSMYFKIQFSQDLWIGFCVATISCCVTAVFSTLHSHLWFL